MFVIFPGQGSQKSHMGKSLAHIPSLMKYVEVASAITEKDVAYLINEAEASELDRTENAQIAIFVLTYALAMSASEKFTMLAGHSLGEYTALCVAGVLSFEDTCLLIKERSRLMQQVEGKMIALLGANMNSANTIASLASTVSDPCFVANHNASSQIVLSGSATAIEQALKIAGDFGMRGVLLPVSGPFHSPLMLDACSKLSVILDKLQFNEPKIPVISNVYASSDVNWRKAVEIHMRAPVRWKETLDQAADKEILEIGATSLLTNMAKRDGCNIRYKTIEEYA